MGAGLLLKYATQSGSKCELDSLAIVATPFDFLHSAKKSTDLWPHFGIPGLFILKILRKLGRKLEGTLNQWPEELKKREIDFEDIYNSKTYFEYDSKLTAKICNLSSGEEYYKKASACDELENLRIPVFALTSLDDPIIHNEAIPYEDFKRLDRLILMTVTTGGHLGFYSGNIIPKRWFHVPCLEYFQAILSMSDSS